MINANLLGKSGLFPIVMADSVEDPCRVAEIFLGEGLGIMEIPCRTEHALSAIKNICKLLPEMMLGAGSLLSKADIERAMDAGARFGVAPGLDPASVQHACQLQFPFVPGVLTPSEIQQALLLGATTLKVFPAELSGGPPYLKAIAEPFRTTPARFIPVGGVTLANAKDYLAIPQVCALGGTCMAPQELIRVRDWDGLRKHVRLALETVKAARNAAA